VRYRHHGISRKLALGGYSLFDLKAAREKARVALRAVADGGDPANEKVQNTYTIEKLTAEFVDNYCKLKNHPETVGLVELCQLYPRLSRLHLRECD
jgi:hypothetical protein